MTWIDVLLAGVLLAAVAAILVWLDIVLRKWAAVVWAGVVAVLGLVSRMTDSPERENPDDTKPEPRPLDEDIDEYSDDDETLDTHPVADDGDTFLLDLHRQGTSDVRSSED